jgi:hypothetical protein
MAIDNPPGGRSLRRTLRATVHAGWVGGCLGRNTPSAGAAGAQRADHKPRVRDAKRDARVGAARGGRGTHQHRHVRDVNCAHGALCYAARGPTG